MKVCRIFALLVIFNLLFFNPGLGKSFREVPPPGGARTLRPGEYLFGSRVHFSSVEQGSVALILAYGIAPRVHVYADIWYVRQTFSYMYYQFHVQNYIPFGKNFDLGSLTGVFSTNTGTLGVYAAVLGSFHAGSFVFDGTASVWRWLTAERVTPCLTVSMALDLLPRLRVGAGATLCLPSITPNAFLTLLMRPFPFVLDLRLTIEPQTRTLDCGAFIRF